MNNKKGHRKRTKKVAELRSRAYEDLSHPDNFAGEVEKPIEKVTAEISTPNQRSSTLIPAEASATRRGAILAVLAGRPSKQGVVAVFGKSGYLLSWVARAEKLGMPVEELCAAFKSNAEGVKAMWDVLAAKEKEQK